MASVSALRCFAQIAVAAAAFGSVTAHAQVPGTLPGTTRPYLSMNLVGADYRLFSSGQVNVEMAVVDLPRITRFGGEARPQGLNLSLVGRKPLMYGVGLYARVGTTYGQADNLSAMGASGADSFGLSYGAGVSMDFTPRLSARFGWDSHDLRTPGGGLRATSLGLQYRY